MKQLKLNLKCRSCGSMIMVDIPLDVLEDKIQCCCLSCKESIVLAMPDTYINRYKRTMTLNIQANEFTDAQSFRLTSDFYTIGRKSSCEDFRPSLEILTSDKRMSRFHAVIRKRSKGFTVQNRSNNGLLLNGERVFDDKEYFVRDGDQLVLGRTLFIVTIDVYDTNLDY